MVTTHSTLLNRDGGTAALWSEFHRLYAPLLYRYARGRGLSREDAEEVRDQCLEVVTRKIPTFDYDKEKGGFKNWLYQIAHRKVIDLLRKRRERIGNSDEIWALQGHHPSPDELWEQHWKAEHLKYCCEQIWGLVSEVNFKTFHMLMFDECSVKEICSRLGLSAN